jgi:hypothetical protein
MTKRNKPKRENNNYIRLESILKSVNRTNSNSRKELPAEKRNEWILFLYYFFKWDFLIKYLFFPLKTTWKFLFFGLEIEIKSNYFFYVKILYI